MLQFLQVVFFSACTKVTKTLVYQASKYGPNGPHSHPRFQNKTKVNNSVSCTLEGETKYLKFLTQASAYFRALLLMLHHLPKSREAEGLLTLIFLTCPSLDNMCKKGWWWCALSCVKNRLIGTGDPWRSAPGQPPCMSTIHMYPKNNTQGYENTHPFSLTSFSFPLWDSNWRVEIIAESTELFIEEQAFLSSYGLAPPPPPSPSASCHSFSVFLRVAGRAYRGRGERPSHTMARMPGPL
jgi:hypothetical protein